MKRIEFAQGTARILVCLIVFLVAFVLRYFEENIVGIVGLDPTQEFGRILVWVIEIFFWLTGAVLVNSVIQLLLWQFLVARSLGTPAPALLRQLSDLVVYFLTALIVVRVVFDESIMGFITAFGAVGVVAAFGLRGLVADVCTGLAVNLEKPYQIGDWVAFYDTTGGEIIGRVEQINWRTTHVTGEDQRYYVVPNREVGDSMLINYWRPEKLWRDEFEIELDYTVTPDEAKRVLLAAVTAVLHQPGFASDREPSVLVKNFDRNGIDYRVRYWITPWEGASPNSAADIVRTSVYRHLRFAGITPSYEKMAHYQVSKPEILEANDHSAHLSMHKMLNLMEFFSPLTDKEIDYVIEKCHEDTWQSGDTLIAQGDSGESMFVVLQGLLDVFIADGDSDEIRVGQIEAGEFFGEMSLLTGEPRGATIRARTTVFALEIKKSIFEELLRQRPRLGETIADIVARRQCETEAARADHEDSRSAEAQRLAKNLYGKMLAFFGS